MGSISNPSFNRPIQMIPNILCHCLFHRSVASLLRRHGVATWFHARPFSDLLNEPRRTLGKEIFILYHPDISNTLVLLDRQEVSNLVSTELHNVIVGFSTAIVSHFVKWLMLRIKESLGVGTLG